MDINTKPSPDGHSGYRERQLLHRPGTPPIILIRSGCTLGPEPPSLPDAGTKAGGGPPVEAPGGGGNPPPGGGKPPGGKGGMAPAGAGEAFTKRQSILWGWWRTYALLLVA